MTEEESDYPEYATYPVPDKPKHEYDVHERRSLIYNWIESAGHPRALSRSQKEIGQEFGVSQAQISKDITAIKEYEGSRIGKDAEAKTQMVCEAAVRNLMEEDEYDRAAKIQLKYYDWLFDTGERDREPEKHDVTIQEQWKQALNNEED